MGRVRVLLRKSSSEVHSDHPPRTSSSSFRRLAFSACMCRYQALSSGQPNSPCHYIHPTTKLPLTLVYLEWTRATTRPVHIHIVVFLELVGELLRARMLEGMLHSTSNGRDVYRSRRSKSPTCPSAYLLFEVHWSPVIAASPRDLVGPEVHVLCSVRTRRAFMCIISIPYCGRSTGHCAFLRILRGSHTVRDPFLIM